ncbi:hypothetical protein H4N54_03175 [Limnospira fusiformis KN01]|nr:hypothetical protein [Limnospira fusiformis]ULB48442.1 hypothetical protein H4N54_03175 [Limnospira fusiformis KN01]
MTKASLKKGFEKSKPIKTCVCIESYSMGESSEKSFQAPKEDISSS